MEFNLDKITRKNIASLKPYSSARDEYSGKEGVFLDANENPFGPFNRYPDPYQRELKEKLSSLKNIAAEQVFVSNGSDEVIDLVYRIFCNPGKDQALTFTPTYGMYEVAAEINGVELLKVPLDENFQPDMEQIRPLLKNGQLKVIFICSPNNPTGNLLHEKDVKYILENFRGIVFIDEAYIDFANASSWIQELDKYPNLLVSQTMSKAWGLASARIGLAFAGKELIRLFNKVKPPYNVSGLNQEAALSALDQRALFEERKQQILEEKQLLEQELKRVARVKKIYPSDANFLLVEVDDANMIYKALAEAGIVVRNRHSIVENCIRITVGTADENKQLIQKFKEIV